MAEKRHVKVLKLRILKPAGDMSWKDLGQLLRDVRYRVFRLANLAVSEAYLSFHLFRTGRTDEIEKETIGQLNRRLRDMFVEEGVEEEELNRISKNGVLPSYVCDALVKYKVGALTSPAKWRDVVRGKASLPTFRNNMAIPIRCDKKGSRRLERTEENNAELDLMCCVQPYPRVVLETGKLRGGPRAILDRLLDNADQLQSGYRQRCFEVKQQENPHGWWLYVTYDFPTSERLGLNKETVVGVDLGFACPMYVALNNGHARLGWRHFVALGARIRSLQRQVMARRRSMLTGGRSSLSDATARSGHGRKRKLGSIEKLSGRVNDAYTTLNHQLSATLIDFALNHGAGVIQMEDLSGLQEHLTGTFLGARWRYHQLQSFIKYKADEAGVEVRSVNPRYTSRRCSQCGHIHVEFDRKFRDANRKEGMLTRFRCPECEFEADPDYNAARNIATLDIAKLIEGQCNCQGID